MKHLIPRILLTGAALLFSVPAVYSQETAKAPAADNTKVNKRDRADSQKTADQAKENTTDRELMQKIRQAVVADKSLSTYAHNVKIIATHGKITLKGPVRTEDEKKTIEAKAVEVAGAGNVTNQISIQPDKSGNKS